MSQHPTTNDPDQTQEIEEGYETPTSEEHRIPPVNYDSPPPAPRKRKRLLVDAKISVAKVILVDKEELDSILDMLESETTRPPLRQVSEWESESETESESKSESGTIPKKIRSDK